MTSYSNLHLVFEQMRIRAKNHAQSSTKPGDSASPEPPRVLIIGPENSGKTSACKILTNYAVKSGRLCTPMLVNVDPGEVRSPRPPMFIAKPYLLCRELGLFRGHYLRPSYLLQSQLLLPPAHWVLLPLRHPQRCPQLHFCLLSTGMATRTLNAINP